VQHQSHSAQHHTAQQNNRREENAPKQPEREGRARERWKMR
jgi:hypothetical protein